MAVGDERQQGMTAAADEFPVEMRVLTVDDDPVCLKILETFLRHCKYHATMAMDGETALRMLRAGKEQYDLVISDVHMPDMDGFRLLELIGLQASGFRLRMLRTHARKFYGNSRFIGWT